MADVRGAERLPDRWDDGRAAGMSEPELLLYRSNLLGSDLRITNFGGGNTSAKVVERDPLTGRDVTVLWVKGSGGELGSMKKDGFATLHLDKLEQLKGLYRGLEHEDEVVGYLPHCNRMRQDLFYADPLFWFDHCKRRYSRKVSLLHDYPLYEFTILVKP